MTNKKKLNEELRSFDQLSQDEGTLLSKLDEFITLLDKSDINSDNIRDIKIKLNNVLDEKLNGAGLIEEVKNVATAEIDKLTQLDQLEILLKNNHFDSNDTKKVNFKQGISKGIRIIIGLLFVTLGFAMIIMPAPPYFEMFTIFYFNPDDGVTLMDLISLIIVAVGIYLVINAMLNLKPDE